MLPLDKIVKVEQPCNKSCSAACIAMVTGLNVNYIIETIEGDPPFQPLEVFKCLVRNNILPVLQNDLLGSYMFDDGAYLLTLPSKNKIAGLHHVIGIRNGAEITILDPSKTNSYNSIEAWNKGFLECIRLIDCSK